LWYPSELIFECWLHLWNLGNLNSFPFSFFLLIRPKKKTLTERKKVVNSERAPTGLLWSNVSCLSLFARTLRKRCSILTLTKLWLHGER
jgi:hypothetical protein